MPVKRYKKSHFVDAMQFVSTDADHIQDIINFVGLPISIEFKADGSVELRLIRNALHVPIAQLNDYIVRYPDGDIKRVPADEFDYEEVDQ